MRFLRHCALPQASPQEQHRAQGAINLEIRLDKICCNR
jgi:hypothetical protein